MNYRDYNDNELISLIEEKSEEANELIYKKYKPLIVGISKKMFQSVKNSGVEMNDLIQEGMLGLNQAINGFDPSKDVTFYTFAKTCIERRMLSLIISTKRLKHKILNESLSFDLSKDGEETNLLDIIGGLSNEPESLVIDSEFEEEFINLVKKELTDLEEQVFMLKINDFSYVEIAELLEKTPKSIDNTLQRIKSKVRKILDERK